MLHTAKKGVVQAFYRHSEYLTSIRRQAPSRHTSILPPQVFASHGGQCVTRGSRHTGVTAFTVTRGSQHLPEHNCPSGWTD